MKALGILLFAVIAAAVSAGCAQKSEPHQQEGTGANVAQRSSVDLSRYSRATFAAGCFWCEEAIFESVRGVAEVISGYAGGQTNNPSYQEVGTGTTGHAEAIEVYYDSAVVDYPTLLRVFFASQDPTQVNGQGPDIGTQYRSIVFYRNPEEKRLAVQYIDMLNRSGRYARPVATEVVAYTKFWQAEEYHQDYIRHHPDDPYVRGESIPRLRRTQQQVPELME